MFEDLIDQLTESDNTPADEQAIRDFNEACKRVDTDPRERQRIRDIANLVDADDLIYGQALAAIDRGDHDAAVPLLRRCAAAGIGESAWLLATVLDELGEPEAVKWYLRAAREGDQRAETKLAELRPRPVQAPHGPDSNAPSGLILIHYRDAAAAELEIAPYSPWAAGLVSEVTPWDLVASPGPLTDPLHRFRPNSRSLNYDAAIACLFAPLYRILWWECKSSGAASGFTTTLVDLRNELAHQRRTDTNQRAHWLLSYWTDALSCDLAESHARRRRVAAPVKGYLSPWTEYGTLLSSWHSTLLGIEIGGPSVRRVETAADVMLPLESATAITADATVHDAFEQLVRSAAKVLPVRDRSDVIGVITLTDIAGHIYQVNGLPSIQRVETMMHPPTTVPAWHAAPRSHDSSRQRPHRPTNRHQRGRDTRRVPDTRNTPSPGA